MPRLKTDKTMLRVRPGFYALLCAVVFFSFAFAVLDDFGVTWDEPLHFRTAGHYVESLLAGDLVFSPGEFKDSMQYYGPFFDIWGELSARLFFLRLNWFPEDFSRHLHLIVLGAGTVFVIFLLAAQSLGRRAGFFAVGFLVTAPRFLGHCFNNPKDLPLAFMATLCVYCFYRRLQSSRRIWSLGLLLAGAVGFSSRITYLIVPCFLVGYLLGNNLLDRIQRLEKSERVGVPLDVLLALIFSFPLGLVLWPFFWSDVLVRLQGLFEFFSHHPVQADVLVRYWGKIYTSGRDLPWHYAPVMLGISAPPALLIFSALGIASGIGRTRSRLKPVLLGLAWLLGGLLIFSLPGQRVYDGIRHFLFVVPGLCFLAAVGLERLARRLRPWLCGILLGGLALWLIIPLYSYHPYYTCYYNELVGGAPGAYGNFSLDYWGNAYKKACLWLNRRAPFGARVLVPGPVPPELARIYLRRDLIMLGPDDIYGRGEPYDYSILTIHQENPLIVNYDPIFTGRAGGQPVVEVHSW